MADYTSYCSLTYDGHLLDQELDGYTTINVEGRGLISRVLSSVEVPGRDGDLVLEQKVAPREIRIYFLIKAPNSASFLQRVTALQNAIRRRGIVEFSFGDEPFSWFGYFADVEPPPFDQHEGIGVITMHCEDSYKYGQIKSSTGVIASTLLYPIKPTTITATLTASANPLIIKNNTTGKQIKLNASFSAGDVVVFNFTANTIKKSGVSILSTLDIQSDFERFLIKGGDTITAASATLAITYREAFL